MHILFICTANLQRSVAAEEVFNEKKKELGLKGDEARSAGIMFGAVNRVSEKDLEWADRIYVMEDEHLKYIQSLKEGVQKKTEVLHIPDYFANKKDPELRTLIEKKLHTLFEELQPHKAKN